MFEITVTTHFAAAHQLKMVADKCESMHGHNWKVAVTVAGDRLNDAGILMDFGDLKRFVAEIMQTLDHKYLNELAPFAGGNPSSENIAVYVADTLAGKLTPPLRVARVTAWESDSAAATYFPAPA
jgi:6-pyruvoyltetrahydropterin/6-carboxytetrahydropterin synthase